MFLVAPAVLSLHLAVPALFSCSSHQQDVPAVSPERDMISCYFTWGQMRSLEKKWVKGVAVSPSALCPQIPPMVLSFGASDCCALRCLLLAASLCSLKILI